MITIEPIYCCRLICHLLDIPASFTVQVDDNNHIPFCSACKQDTIVTGRYKENDFEKV